MYYGVRRHKGFVVLTGEVGTGKTLLLRCLLQILRLSDVHHAYVFNSRLGPMEFLQYVVADFGLPVSPNNKSELLITLSRFVISRFKKRLTTVLVIDEAHHLTEDVLEEIRLLTNLETANQKLLQILLVGQPELDEKLDSINLRQLKQRIAVRAQLSPLEPEETAGYIRSRLQVAGNTTRHSRGIPRLINTLCENALIHGYGRQTARITPAIIQEIAMDFRLSVVNSRPKTEITASGKPSSDVEDAAKTLLDLYSSLRRAQSTRERLRGTVEKVGARDNEPYI